jgi:VWFA-related protein
VALLAVAVPSVGQELPTSPIPSQLEERVLVQLVQLPILALDRQGRPVNDLNPEEIEVKLRGDRMKVSYLDPILERPAPVATRPDVRLLLDAPGGWSSPVGTNPVEPRYIAFLFDNENDDPLRREEALQKTIQFVDSGLEPNVRAAVLSYAGTLELELPFTSDREALKTAILRAGGREGRPRRAGDTRMRQLLDRMDDCVVSRSDFGNTGDPLCLRDVANEYIGEVRPLAEDFLRALTGLVEYMGGLDGRKSVFVVSHGLPIDPAPVVLQAARALFGNPDTISSLQLYIGFGTEPRVQMDRLLDSLIRSRITLNFVDRTPRPSGDVGAKRGQMLSPGSFPLQAEYEAATADMEQIAFTSGGVHVQTTDITAALRTAFDAQKGAYELGFQTSEYLDPDKLAKVSVTCTRRGVKIQHRRGVYAAPPQAEQRLPGRIAFTKGRPLQGERAPGIHQPFRLEVEPRAIGYETNEVEARADFTVHFKIEAEDGVSLADTYHFISHAYERERWEAPDRPPMTLAGWVELPPGTYTLRATLRNVRTGQEGFVSQAVKVPETVGRPPESNPRDGG